MDIPRLIAAILADHRAIAEPTAAQISKAGTAARTSAQAWVAAHPSSRSEAPV
jgi:hypothetical protein